MAVASLSTNEWSRYAVADARLRSRPMAPSKRSPESSTVIGSAHGRKYWRSYLCRRHGTENRERSGPPCASPVSQECTFGNGAIACPCLWLPEIQRTGYLPQSVRIVAGPPPGLTAIASSGAVMMALLGETPMYRPRAGAYSSPHPITWMSLIRGAGIPRIARSSCASAPRSGEMATPATPTSDFKK
jgi:hypothetical protein